MEITPIYIHTHTTPIEISLSETLRYMGCTSEPTQEIQALALRAIETVQTVASCKACYRLCDFSLDENCVIDFGIMKLKSDALTRHLKCCKKAYIFAASIGIEPDRLILKHKHTSPSFALALQAAGAAAIESYCDVLCDKVFAETANAMGLYPVSRFSAGYEDLDLSYQKQIFDSLDCTRKIGLTLTEGDMMMPSKSVTAFVGLGDAPAHDVVKCKICTNLKCAFRKENNGNECIGSNSK